MNSRKIYNWRCRERVMKLGERTRVMGILNVTPDSFSDGGNFSDPAAAVERGLKMAAEGADIIDIGGESTRPGAKPVPVAEEIRRTVSVIEKIREQSTIFISIDTTKAEVALRALEAGADIINDISAFEADERMVNIAEKSKAGVILMHMKGSPKTMQENPNYENVVAEVEGYLRKRVNFSKAHGVEKERIVIDPGIGFGKTVEHNIELLRRLPKLEAGGCPVLVGASRKSFIGHVLGRDNPTERMGGSLGVAAWSILHGAHILRVHDVIDTCDVCRLLDTLLTGEHSCS